MPQNTRDIEIYKENKTVQENSKKKKKKKKKKKIINESKQIIKLNEWRTQQSTHTKNAEGTISTPLKASQNPQMLYNYAPSKQSTSGTRALHTKQCHTLSNKTPLPAS